MVTVPVPGSRSRKAWTTALVIASESASLRALIGGSMTSRVVAKPTAPPRSHPTHVATAGALQHSSIDPARLMALRTLSVVVARGRKGEDRVRFAAGHGSSREPPLTARLGRIVVWSAAGSRWSHARFAGERRGRPRPGRAPGAAAQRAGGCRRRRHLRRAGVPPAPPRRRHHRLLVGR